MTPQSQYSRLSEDEAVRLFIGGCEVNVGAALAQLGWHVRLVTALPRNPLGERALCLIRSFGIDTEHVSMHAGGRMGLYLHEQGTFPAEGVVSYDRSDSAFSRFSSDQVHVSVLEGASWLMISGITLALGGAPRAAALALVRAARDRRVSFVYDLNHRSRLGPAEEAALAFHEIAPAAQLLVMSSRDAAVVLGLEGSAAAQAHSVRRQFPEATVVITDGSRGAVALGSELVGCGAFPAEERDRIGRGDAFVAGLLWGFQQRDLAYGLRCGTALAALKQQQRGDVVRVRPEDLASSMDNAEIQR